MDDDYARTKRAELIKGRSKTEERVDKIIRRECWDRGIDPLFQHIIEMEDGFVIADWYIPERGLVIEVDGPHHYLQADEDADRDHGLADGGIAVRRIPSSTVWQPLIWQRTVKSLVISALDSSNEVYATVMATAPDPVLVAFRKLLKREHGMMSTDKLDPMLLELCIKRIAYEFGMEIHEVQKRIDGTG